MFDEGMGVLKEIVQTCTNQHRNTPNAASMKKGLLGYILSAQAPDKNSNLAGLGNGLIFGQILALSFAGYETPANTLAWVVCLMVKHPGIQQCVVQEHAGVRTTPGATPTVKQVNQFKYPRQLTKGVLYVLLPVLVAFISTGTGVAPFSGFQQEMQGTDSSSVDLYFACHSPEYDCLYQDEFEAYVEDNTLIKPHPAFSRIGDGRMYVQHHITTGGASTWKCLNEMNGRTYVCGSADCLAMVVVVAMLRIFDQVGGTSPDISNNNLSNLVSAGCYVESAW
ncbi:ferredoxin reductase-like protein [Martensiomyces pterosporus]|nr:ferredoxin reductase-like protein [Martensiomyces pterosporus]